MATLTLQLTTVSGNLSPAPSNPIDNDATITPVNANQAQGAPAPLDTVTLASQTPQGQTTGQNQRDGQLQSQLQSTPAFAAAAALFASAISATSQNGNDPATTPAASASPNSTNAQSTLVNVANTALQQSTAATGSQPNLAQTQKQQLQQLDETLRQLGIDPQNISVFNQLAMLFYSDNPSGLQQFIRQFQQAAQKNLQQGIAASEAESQTASQTLSDSASTAASAAQSGNSTAQTVADSSSQSSPAALQFQELQFAVAAVGGKVQLPRSTSAPSPPEKSLDVTL